MTRPFSSAKLPPPGTSLRMAKPKAEMRFEHSQRAMIIFNSHVTIMLLILPFPCAINASPLPYAPAPARLPLQHQPALSPVSRGICSIRPNDVPRPWHSLVHGPPALSITKNYPPHAFGRRFRDGTEPNHRFAPSMAFSFGFSGDDIEEDPHDTLDHVRPINSAGSQVPPPIAAKAHDLDELVGQR